MADNNKLIIAVVVVIVLLLAYYYMSQPVEGLRRVSIPLPSTLAHQSAGSYFPTLPPYEGMAVSAQAPSLPFGLSNDEVVRCAQTGRLYKIESNQARHYAKNAYVRDGRPQYRDINCGLLNSTSHGPDM